MAEIEGFLCPLCMQDCRSVKELESHYREKHDESSRSGTSKVKKFFVQVGNSLKLESSPRPKRTELGDGTKKEELGGRSISSEDGMVVVGPVTNVSGIDPLEWDPQEIGSVPIQITQHPPLHTSFSIGRITIHSIEFRRTRDAYLADITVDTNRLVIRLEKVGVAIN